MSKALTDQIQNCTVTTAHGIKLICYMNFKQNKNFNLYK